MKRGAQRRRLGQSAVETLIALPVLVALAGGAFQLSLLFRAKLVLNHAAFQAARAGAVSEGDPWAIHEALAENLTALYSHGPEVDDYLVARARAEVQSLSWVQVQRLSPELEDFEDHGEDDSDGVRRIPVSHLRYREPDSSRNRPIQDANQLRLRVVYCHPLQIPLINRTIIALVGPDLSYATGNPDPAACASEPDFERRCYCAWRLPIESQALVRMQSAGAKLAP